MPYNDIWEELLPKTIQFNKCRSSFYSDRLKQIPNQLALTDFCELPLLTRGEVTQAGERFFCNGLETSKVSTTSGTSGRPLFYVRCREEALAYRTLLPVVSPKDTPPTSLHLQHVAHGAHFLSHYDPNKIFFHGGSASAFETIPGLLAGDIKSPGQRAGISRLYVHAKQLIRLTEYLTHHSVDFGRFSLEKIIVTADYLSDSKRAWMEKQWSVPLQMVYGLSEVLGSNTAEFAPNIYSFPPSVIPECVTSTGETCKSGDIGELALTSLVPFSQATNFVRYLTGDFFRFCPTPGTSLKFFEFLGRASNSRRIEDTILYGRTIFEFFDRQTDISRGFGDRLVTYSHSAAHGSPLVAVSSVTDNCLRISCRFHTTPTATQLKQLTDDFISFCTRYQPNVTTELNRLDVQITEIKGDNSRVLSA